MNGTTVVTTPAGCHDTLAQELASFGDWAGLDALPKRFASGVWLCVSEQILTGAAWRAPAARIAPQPSRACAAAS